MQLLDLYHRQFSQVIYLSKAALLLEIKSTGVLSSPFPSLTLVMPENKINKHILNLYLIYNIRLFSLEHCVEINGKQAIFSQSFSDYSPTTDFSGAGGTIFPRWRNLLFNRSWSPRKSLNRRFTDVSEFLNVGILVYGKVRS